MMRCEICNQSEDDFDCHTEVAERLPVNYHPVVLCTECMRKLAQAMLTTQELSSYQAALDYCNALRDNYTPEIEELDISIANQRYCSTLKIVGAKMIQIIKEMAELH